jgi:hypothetical protein
MYFLKRFSRLSCFAEQSLLFRGRRKTTFMRQACPHIDSASTWSAHDQERAKQIVSKDERIIMIWKPAREQATDAVYGDHCKHSRRQPVQLAFPAHWRGLHHRMLAAADQS